MLVSIYHLQDLERARARRQPVTKPQMLVGRDAKCDIAIGDDPEVSPRHMTVAVRAVGNELVAEIVVTPLAGSTLVNGRVISAATTTKLGDTIQIGNTILKFRPDSAVRPTDPPPMRGPRLDPAQNYNPNPPSPAPRPSAPRPPRGNPPSPRSQRPPSPVSPPVPIRPNPYRPVLSANPTENTFLTAIRATPTDAASRMVYADWLEQNGLADHAMFVRTSAHLEDPRFLVGCDVDWRAITSRTPIERCAHADCPGAWDQLQATTDDDRARTCGTCTRRIYFIHDHFLIHNLGLLGLPFALDASVDRVSAHQFYQGAPGEPVPTLDDGLQADPGEAVDTFREDE